MEEQNTFGEFPKENSRKVKLTNGHKAEMLKIAQDLRNLLKTHKEGTGTGFFGDKMQQRDALTRAAHILESLVKFI